MKALADMSTADVQAPQHPAGAIEAADEPVDPSEFDPVEWDRSSADSASLTSSVLDHEYENGRRFHRFRHGRYPMPNDETEQDREDMKHTMFLELLVSNVISIYLAAFAHLELMFPNSGWRSVSRSYWR